MFLLKEEKNEICAIKKKTFKNTLQMYALRNDGSSTAI